jgi:1,4-dihydroxy-2-naphthoate octaprenyltransferase
MTRLIDALRTVPRVDGATWAVLPVWTRWAIAARASVLGMTLVSAAIGGLLGLRAEGFSPWLWLVTAIGLVAAHASNNLINDWVDVARGLDTGDYHRARYGTHPLGAGLLSRGGMAVYVGCTAAVAIAAATVAVAARGVPALWLALAGAFFVLFYTWPLKSLGLGEPAVLLVWGPLMTGGACLVASGEWSWTAAGLGSAYALGPTAVLFGKHIDKLEADAARGVRTLPVMLGEPLARRAVMAMIALQLGVPAVLALSGRASMWLVLVLLAAPVARSALAAFAAPRPATRPEAYPAEVWPLWYAHHAFVLTRRSGALLVLALLLAAASG